MPIDPGLSHSLVHAKIIEQTFHRRGSISGHILASGSSDSGILIINWREEGTEAPRTTEFDLKHWKIESSARVIVLSCDEQLDHDVSPTCPKANLYTILFV